MNVTKLIYIAFTFIALVTAKANISFDISLETVFDSTGSNAAAGVPWGVVIDTDGDGSFSATSYLEFDYTSNGFLSNSLGVTDDYYAGFESTSAVGNTFGPAGRLGTLSGVTDQNVLDSAGNVFGVLWLADGNSVAGSFYGFSLDTGSANLVPDSGASVSWTGFTNSVASRQLGAVPEPSTYVAIAGSLVGLFVYFRRRKVAAASE